MSLRDWIASFSIPATATPATTATEAAIDDQPSQLSQLSPSQVSAGTSVASGSDDREAFEERAAIMEYDGGLSREDAERHAAAGFSYQYARAREAGEPPMSEAVPEADKPATVESAKPVSVAAKLEAWGDLRPCTSCRNLLRSGRCRAAWIGLLRASRDYEPSHPKQPRRCIGYSPKADDPDQSSGTERWPELAEWQKRIVVNNT